MAYTSLYRKYRPNTFSKVIGQDHVVKTLVNQITSNTVGHAYVFTGTRGTGKTSVAKIFAKAVNCLEPVNGSPCGKCQNCLDLALDGNFDIIELDAASNNGVDQIRDIVDQVNYNPIGKYKVYIIDEVHMLTKSAFNALLKTLEEPPKHAIFILATTEVNMVPATILSRCLRFDFRLVSTKLLVEHVSKIFDEETIKYEPAAVELIAQAGKGSVRDTLSIADMCISYCMGDITYNGVLEVLGANDPETIEKFIVNIINGDLEGSLQLIDELCAKGKSVTVLTQDLAEAIKNIIYIKLCKDAKNLVTLPTDVYTKYKELGKSLTVQRGLQMIEKLNSLYAQYRISTQHRIIFESAILSLASNEAQNEVDLLKRKVATLEKAVAGGVQVKAAPQQAKAQAPRVEVWSTIVKELERRGYGFLALAATDVEVEETDTTFTVKVADKSKYEMLTSTTKPVGTINSKSNREVINEIFTGVSNKKLDIVCEVKVNKDTALPFVKEMFGNRLNTK